MAKKLPVIESAPGVIEAMQKAMQRTVHGSQHNAILDTLLCTPPKEELAYIAGFFDGEGTCHLRKNKRGKYLFKTVHVSIGQTQREVLDWLVTFYSGSIYVYKKGVKHRTQDFHQWSIVGTRAVKFLLDIYPWCVIKRYDIDRTITEKYIGV